MKNTLIIASILSISSGIGLAAPSAVGQEAAASIRDQTPPASPSSSLQVPAETRLAVHVNPILLGRTEVGHRLSQIIEGIVAENFETDRPIATQIAEIIGFDPLENLSGLTLMTDDLTTSPTSTESIQAVVEMKDSVGNLEGLAMTLPEYQSKMVEGRLRHQFQVKSGTFHATILSKADGGGTLLAADDPAGLQSLVDSQNGDNAQASQTLTWTEDPGTLLQVHLAGIPEGILDQAGPLAAFELIQTADATLTEGDEDFRLRILVHAADEARSEQFRQLFEGMKAMMSMAGETIDDGDPDEEMRQVIDLVRQTQVRRDGNSVRLSVSVPQGVVWQVLEDEFGVAR